MPDNTDTLGWEDLSIAPYNLSVSTDSIGLESSSTTHIIAQALTDDIGWQDSTTTKVKGLSITTDSIGFSGSLWAKYSVSNSDAIGFVESSTTLIKQKVVNSDSIGFQATGTLKKSTITLNSDSIGFIDSTRLANKQTNSDSIGFNVLSLTKIHLVNVTTDLVGFSASGFIKQKTLNTDSIGFGAASSLGIRSVQIQTDSIGFIDYTVILEELLAYVMNTKTGGVSEYTDTDFNSMSFPLGCKSDGIYHMDGGPDGDVTASIKTGMMDFGTSLKKQIPNIYLGITNNERVVVKVVTTTQGIKVEHQYEVKSYNNATDTTRGDLGKGVKAKYWQFELSEIKDRLESFEVLYNTTSRRK